MSYNGYKNYATWNVCLWCDNDYHVYKAAQRHGKFTPTEAEDFVHAMFPEMTPDMQTEPRNMWSEVDWYEVAENFNAE